MYINSSSSFSDSRYVSSLLNKSTLTLVSELPLSGFHSLCISELSECLEISEHESNTPLLRVFTQNGYLPLNSGKLKVTQENGILAISGSKGHVPNEFCSYQRDGIRAVPVKIQLCVPASLLGNLLTFTADIENGEVFCTRNIVAHNETIIESSGPGDISFVNIDSERNFRIKSSGSSDIKILNINSLAAKVRLSGSGNIVTNSIITNDDIDVSISGSGDIKIISIQTKGKVEMSVAGSGDIKVKACAAYLLDCKISGSGNINVKDAQIENETSAKISGSGDITISGTTGSKSKKNTGSGDISMGSLMIRQ